MKCSLPGCALMATDRGYCTHAHRVEHARRRASERVLGGLQVVGEPELRPIAGCPGYWISSDGRLFSDRVRRSTPDGFVSVVDPALRHEVTTCRVRDDGELVVPVPIGDRSHDQRQRLVRDLLAQAWPELAARAPATPAAPAPADDDPEVAAYLESLTPEQRAFADMGTGLRQQLECSPISPPSIDPKMARNGTDAAATPRNGTASPDAAFPNVARNTGPILPHKPAPARAVKFSETSANRKLGPVTVIGKRGSNFHVMKARAPFVSSTFVSIAATCPDTCAFKRSGCFADAGFTRILSKRLDEAAAGQTEIQVIADECRAILRSFRGSVIPQDGARGGRDLRLHVGGDVRSTQAAELLARAARDWRRRGGGAVWTFTHSWQQIPRSAFGPISVLASIESPAQAAAALAQGYAPVIVVDQFPSSKAFGLPGAPVRFVPCPAETRSGAGVTCATCRLCLDRDLVKLGLGIAFEAHGTKAQQVREKLVQIRTPGAPPPTRPAPKPRLCHLCGKPGHIASSRRFHPLRLSDVQKPRIFDVKKSTDQPPPRLEAPVVPVERLRTAHRVRARTLAPKRLTRDELALRTKLTLADLEYDKPVFRSDCRDAATNARFGGPRVDGCNAERPCPWVRCKHHLYLDVNPETGSIKLNFPDLEVWELGESCALDVAETGGTTLESVGELLNLTRERIRQVEFRALLQTGVLGTHDAQDPRPKLDQWEEAEQRERDRRKKDPPKFPPGW